MSNPSLDECADLSAYAENLIAIVLCAGFGTRLRPLTNHIPKIVIPLGETPIAFHSIRQLYLAGLREIHCNTHYLAPLAESELHKAALDAGYHDLQLRFWREETLLETGGGIARICQQLALENPQAHHRDLLVISGDIFGTVPLKSMFTAWAQRSADDFALMVTSPLPEGRKDPTWLDVPSATILGFGLEHPARTKALGRNFAGYQILKSEIPLRSPVLKQSSIPLFYKVGLDEGKRIINVDLGVALPWHNVGTYSEYADCVRLESASLGQEEQSLLKQCLVVEKVAKTENKNPTRELMLTCGDSCYTLRLINWPQHVLLTGKFRSSLNSGSDILGQIRKLYALFPEPFISAATAPLEFAEGLAVSSSELPPSAVAIRLWGVSLGLSVPLLVPLELLEAPSLAAAFFTANPYVTSQTFFVIS
jgi:NDP-sugar pyrophosphorylase family protein